MVILVLGNDSIIHTPWWKPEQRNPQLDQFLS